MTTTRKPVTTALAAALLTALTGGAALAGAAPAVAAPVATSTALVAPTAVGESRPIAGSAATSRQVVAARYRYFLDAHAPIDRYRDSGYWMGRLDSGEDPAAVLSDLRTTREYAGSAVRAIYRAYLDRDPDAGARYWVDGVVDGSFPLEWVEQNVAASDEYLLRTSTDGRRGAGGGASDVAIEGWCSAVLKRVPSTGERAYWLGRFGSGSALGVFRQLWCTPEAVTVRLQSHHTTLLGRSARSADVAYWYQREVVSDAAVIAQVASSPEYADRLR